MPVKTTNDLLVLRSDCYELDDDHVLHLLSDTVPFVDLDPAHYKLVGDFDAHFADGVPSLRQAKQLVVNGDWSFGSDVRGGRRGCPRRGGLARTGAARNRAGLTGVGVPGPSHER